MKKQYWGKADEKDVYLVTISDEKMQAVVSNYGGALVKLMVPGKSGMPVDVVMGFDTLEEYMKQQSYVGVTVGRCANRIKNASFLIDGKKFSLDQNEGKNHLHGGKKGFDKVVWDIHSYGEDFVVLKYLSPDGEGGYPGNLKSTVTYRLTGNQLEIRYKGVSDQDTVMNLTNHSYFNLNGQGIGTVEDHMARIEADYITEIDRESCSTGNLLPVAGTPFDLNIPQRIGDLLSANHEQMRYGDGFDHNYVLKDLEDKSKSPIADLFSPLSGIRMEVFTDREGMHFYAGTHLDGTLQGKGGVVYPKFGAVCFETQHFPDAVNLNHFPSPILRKGEEKRSWTAFRFETIE